VYDILKLAETTSPGQAACRVPGRMHLRAPDLDRGRNRPEQAPEQEGDQGDAHL